MSRNPDWSVIYIALATEEEPLTVPTLWGSGSSAKEIDKYRLGAFVPVPTLTHVMESLMILSGTSDFNSPEWIVPLQTLSSLERSYNLQTKHELYAKGEEF